MANDRLILLQPGFSDSKQPGEQYVCIDCLHVALAAQAGEAPLWTFDKAASRIEGARLMGR